MFLLGLAGFTLTNMLCGLATSALVLVVARVAYGVAAALLVPQVLGAIPTLFDDERGLARAMSAYGIMMGLAAAAGQFGGGALVTWSPWDLGWRGVFLLKLPVCLVVFAAAWFVVPETSTSRRARLDGGGIFLLSATLAWLDPAAGRGRQLHWGRRGRLPVWRACRCWWPRSWGGCHGTFPGSITQGHIVAIS